MEKADAVGIVVNKSGKSTLDFVQGKHDSLAAACATLLVFVLDADTEATQISDKVRSLIVSLISFQEHTVPITFFLKILLPFNIHVSVARITHPHIF